MIRTDLVDMIRSVLSPDLLHPVYRGAWDHPLTGHCYIASEAYKQLASVMYGDDVTVWFIRVGKSSFVNGVPHWFLKHEGDIIDITAPQFRTPVPYDQARRKGFLTKYPSKRAWIVIDRVRDLKRRLDG